MSVPFFSPLLGRKIHIGHIANLFVKLFIVRGSQPIPNLMRLQVRFLQQPPDMSGRNALDNLTLDEFVSQFAGGPMTNRPTGLPGVFASNGIQMG